MKCVRVATSQYRTTNDVQGNLGKLLTCIADAAQGGAQLLVAPEFGNHTSFYSSQQQAWDVAVTQNGPYVSAVQEQARRHRIHVVFNATRRSEDFPVMTICNFLIGPDGLLIGYDDKQVLMGGEAETFCGSDHVGRVFETTIGRIGMMSCLDGVPPETARNLALLGAQIITNTHNSCALDEPFAHIPARAAENGVWVIAAGKVGPICIDEMIEPLAEQVGIPAHLITALGENPILNPQGEAVARLPCLDEGIIFADIDVSQADNKRTAHGDLFADRRPELYSALAEPPVQYRDGSDRSLKGSIVQLRSDRPFDVNLNRALDLVSDAADNGAQLIVLPELCVFELDRLGDDIGLVVQRSQLLEDALSELCRHRSVHVAASLLTTDGGHRHSGVLLDDKGLRAGLYHQTHLCNTYRSWCQPGDQIPVWETDIGRIGMMLGYDAIFPEVATVLARRGAEIVVHPTTWRFAWEPALILPERAAENRITVLSAARFDSMPARGGMISALAASKPLRARDLNPIWPVEAPADRECHVSADIFPARSRNKDLLGFDLQADRRHQLYQNLVK